MHKRLIHILSIAWIVLTLTSNFGAFFFPIDYHPASAINFSEKSKATHSNIYDDFPESKEKQGQNARSRIRYVVTKEFDANILKPDNQVLACFFAPLDIQTHFRKFVKSKAPLPSYYQFLFRLNPF